MGIRCRGRHRNVFIVVLLLLLLVPSKSTSYPDAVYMAVMEYMDAADFDEFSSAVNDLLRDGLSKNGIEVGER